MTDSSGTLSLLVHWLVIAVLCVSLHVHVFAYVGGCGSCCPPNAVRSFFLFGVRCYEMLKEVKSQTVLWLPSILLVCLLLSVNSHEMLQSPYLLW